MVTAGVFLLARSSFIYEHTNSYILGYISFLGAFTAFLASTVGLTQNDLKRVIAYSTCSQLGYMIFICGLSNYSVGIFHLINHAFFKALLFLGAGSIIHSINDEQDMRKMGGLKNLLPLTYSIIIVGSLALIGFPFLAGFYSKDLILELSYSKYSWFGYSCYFLGTCGAFLTAFYSTRLLSLTFLKKPFGHKSVIQYAQDLESPISFVLVVLSVPSVLVGFYGRDLIVGLGSNFFKTAIYFNTVTINMFDSEFVVLFYKMLPVSLSLLGSCSALILYQYFFNSLYSLKKSFVGKVFYIFFSKKWFFDKIYNECYSQFFFKFGFQTSYKFLDRGVFEFIGPTGVTISFTNIATELYKLQSGYLYHYAFSILVGFSLLIGLKDLQITIGKFIELKLVILMLLSVFFVQISTKNTQKK